MNPTKNTTEQASENTLKKIIGISVLISGILIWNGCKKQEFALPQPTPNPSATPGTPTPTPSPTPVGTPNMTAANTPEPFSLGNYANCKAGVINANPLYKDADATYLCGGAGTYGPTNFPLSYQNCIIATVQAAVPVATFANPTPAIPSSEADMVTNCKNRQVSDPGVLCFIKVENIYNWTYYDIIPNQEYICTANGKFSMGFCQGYEKCVMDFINTPPQPTDGSKMVAACTNICN